jgi:hypothetical protein
VRNQTERLPAKLVRLPMQRRLRLGVLCQSVLLTHTVLLLLAGHTSPLGAQERVAGTLEDEHHGHDNAVAIFLGGMTHLGSDGNSSDTGFAFGLEYARRVASWLSVGILAEGATTETQRDFILALPLFAHVTEKIRLVVGPGVETAPLREGGTEGRHYEFLMRFGAIYELEFKNFVIGPQVNADVVGGRWTMVYGATVGIGF